MKTDNGTIIMFSEDSDEATVCTMSENEETKIKALIAKEFPIKKKRKGEYVLPKSYLSDLFLKGGKCDET